MYWLLSLHLSITTKVESEAEQIYMSAATDNIGFLVVGDPLCATTHTDLMLRWVHSGRLLEPLQSAVSRQIRVVSSIFDCHWQFVVQIRLNGEYTQNPNSLSVILLLSINRSEMIRFLLGREGMSDSHAETCYESTYFEINLEYSHRRPATCWIY